MEKRIIVCVFLAWIVAFLSGCSMMPNDEEIINWSVSELEVIRVDEWMVNNEWVDWQDLQEEIDEENQWWIEEEENIGENEDENVNVEFEVVD